MPIYYTLTVTNNSSRSKALRFEANLNRPLMEKPSEWDVSVIRFSIPNYSAVIMTFKDNFYQMSIEYNSTLVSDYVAYIPTTSDPNYRGIYEIQAIINMLNATINTLYTHINTIVTLPTTEQPYFSYNEVNKLISFTANKNYYLSSLPVPIRIYLNLPLFSILQGLPVFSDAVMGYQLLVFDAHNNNLPSANYFTMTQQASSFENMSDFSGIILTSNLATKNEFSGINTIIDNPLTINADGFNSYNVSNPILQDFIPSDLNINTFHNNIVYYVIGTPFRQAELISDVPFYSIIINSFITTKNGISKPSILQPNSSASVKLMFTKKSENKYA